MPEKDPLEPLGENDENTSPSNLPPLPYDDVNAPTQAREPENYTDPLARSAAFNPTEPLGDDTDDIEPVSQPNPSSGVSRVTVYERCPLANRAIAPRIETINRFRKV